MASSGGASAAAGFQFQYLYTIAVLLDFLDDGDDVQRVVTIEDIRPVDSTPRTMDFSVRSKGSDESFVEVKYRSTSELRVPAALDGLIRMVEFGDAREYVFVSNTGRDAEFDTLNAALASSDPDSEVRRQLIAMSGRAAVADTIRDLDAGQLTLLRRGRVETHATDLDAMYEQVRTRVARWRRNHGLSLGVEAANVLMGRLIAEVFNRAAHAPNSTLSVAEFEQILATGPYVLAQAAGVDESGLGIGQVPPPSTIARTHLTDQLTDALNVGICSERVRWCALHGRSGVGKSRLAATYAHTHRHAYDRILWLNASSREALAASVTARRWLLGIPDGEMSQDQLAEQFRSALAQFPGTWLVVFDDATFASDLRSWLPTTGWGHVLVTTLDRGKWQEFARIDVGRMESHEAQDLLATRMQIEDPSVREDLEDELGQLAEGLDCWPLALEAAAAYIGSPENSAQPIVSYLEEIKTYAIGDPTLDIPSYPRSLLAAISLCLDRIETLASTHRPAAIARRMLTICSYFAYREIPADLVYSWALCTVEEAMADSRHDAPPQHRDPEAPLPACRSVLNSVSIVDFSTHRGPRIRAELTSRIEINDIVQRILRQRADRTRALETAAVELSNWFSYYIEHCGDYAAAMALAPHGGSLLLHSGHPDEAPWEVTAVAGNLAHLHRVHGNLETAQRLLRYELKVLNRYSRDIMNVLKTVLSLLEVTLLGGADAQEVLATADDVLDFVEKHRDRVPPEWIGMSSLSVQSAGEALRRTAEGRDLPTAPYDALIARAVTVRGGVQTSPETELMTLFAELQQRFDAPPESDEVDVARRHLESHSASAVLHRLVARVMLIESLVRAERIPEALEALEDLRHECSDQPHLLVEVPDKLLNVACKVIFSFTFEPNAPSNLLELAKSLLDTAGMFPLDSYDRYRHITCTGAVLGAEGQTAGVQQLSLLLADIPVPDLPHGVASERGVILLRRWIDEQAACASAGVAPSALYTAGIGFGEGIAADGQRTSICRLYLADEDYTRLLARTPGLVCRMQVHVDKTGDPVIISVRGSNDAPLCAIMLRAGEIQGHRFEGALISPISEMRTHPGIRPVANNIQAIVTW